MAIATQPFNEQQITDQIVLDTGRPWPVDGPHGFLAEEVAPGQFNLYDESGTFTEAEIAAAIANVVYDKWYGRDENEVKIRRDAVGVLRQIRNADAMTTAQAKMAVRRLAAILERLLIREFQTEQTGTVHEPT